MNHPSPTLGYCIEAEGRSMCYLCQICSRAGRPWRASAGSSLHATILSHDDECIANVERKARELAGSLDSKLDVRCAYEGCEITV
jgi:hypothetical protein